MVRREVEGINYCVSHTTRKPRQEEVDGVHYYFVTRADFEDMIEGHEFIEWAVVYGELYGTSIFSVHAGLSSGGDLLVDLDIQGAQEMKRKFSESLSIFILPPSMEALRERLIGRSTEEKQSVELRTKNVLEEIQRCEGSDFIVVNDDLIEAAREIGSIISAQRARKERRFPLVKKLFPL